MPGLEAMMPAVMFDEETGTIRIGDQTITGIAPWETVYETRDQVIDISNDLRDRITVLENELHLFRNLFTANLVRELVERCEQFVSGQEYTGMTDEEFEEEIRNLLFAGGA